LTAVILASGGTVPSDDSLSDGGCQKKGIEAADQIDPKQGHNGLINPRWFHQDFEFDGKNYTVEEDNHKRNEVNTDID
jgi:hypothetical protein